MDKPLLNAKNLSIRYLDSDKYVVKDFNFELNKGEILCLRGRSGIGKTTVTAAVMGMLPICNAEAKGNLYYNDIDLISAPESELQKLRWREIALVPQSSMNAFNPVFTIRKTLREMMLLENNRISKAEMACREEELMDMVHLDRSVLGCYAHEMSGGMKQRAAIALSVIYSPKLLILDEATTGLDIKVQADVLGTILQLKQRTDMSILFISHDAELGDQISDRMVEMV
ncbi:MAG: ATP-binding cassette domain-containing protein [Candidatus Scatomorpha sp.]|jgi:peptide/nickel transport system ATP-binding protein